MGEKNEGVSRRNFLSTALTGIVSAGFLGSTAGKVLSQDTKEKSEKTDGGIICRTLGRTGISVPVVSMGVMNSDNPEVVRGSYEIGVRHFDTAAYYQKGNNERMVGTVIRELGVRDKVVIGTKIFTPDIRSGTEEKDIPKTVERLCDESLERLGMDYVDILYIHNVNNTGVASNETLMKTMAALKKKGKAKAIGVTTHTKMHEIINEAAGAGVWDVVLTVVNFTLGDYGELFTAIENAAAGGVGIIAMKTQAGSSRRSNIDFGDEYSSSIVATASLKWVLGNTHIATAVPGYTTFEHMKQDFSVARDLTLTETERKLLTDQNVKVGMGFCRQCELCRSTCPRGVDIPTLMRTHMYAARYSNFHQARSALCEIPNGFGLEACSSCRTCTARCAHSVDIAENIEDLKLIYA